MLCNIQWYYAAHKRTGSAGSLRGAGSGGSEGGAGDENARARLSLSYDSELSDGEGELGCPLYLPHSFTIHTITHLRSPDGTKLTSVIDIDCIRIELLINSNTRCHLIHFTHQIYNLNVERSDCSLSRQRWCVPASRNAGRTSSRSQRCTRRAVVSSPAVKITCSRYTDTLSYGRHPWNYPILCTSESTKDYFK